jgi:glutathione S-transferase
VGKCWIVAGTEIDEHVSTAFLAAAQPPELELALAVSREAERQAGEIDTQWKLRIERARYEARHAERRYKAVEPDNRIVARTLEAQWEEKLREQDEAEREYTRACARKKVNLSDDDRRRILELARDLPRVWRSTTTTQQQRKNLLRILVREVTLTPIDLPERKTRVQVLWESGAVTEYLVDRPRHRARTPKASAVDDAVRHHVARGFTDVQISVELNHEGLRTGMGRAWTKSAVSRVRKRLGIVRPTTNGVRKSVPDQRADGLYSTRAVAERFGVARSTVASWVRSGRLPVADGGGHGRPSWFDLDKEAVGKLAAGLATTTQNTQRGAS